MPALAIRLFALTLFPIFLVAQTTLAPGTVTRIAGTETQGFSGDGGPATNAQFGFISSIALDSSGNLYVASLDHRVRRIDRAGIVTTFAGTGELIPTVNGAPANQTAVPGPTGIFFERDGSLFVGGTFSSFRVSPAGVLTNVPGMPALTTLTQDPSGQIFVATRDKTIVRFENGQVTRVAGVAQTGTTSSGDGGPALEATFASIIGLAVDQQGRVYVGDGVSNTVRTFSLSGSQTVSNFAGSGRPSPAISGGLPATATDLREPAKLLAAHGGIYLTTRDVTVFIDSANIVHRIATFQGTALALDPSGDLLASAPNVLYRITRPDLMPRFSVAAVTNAASFQSGASPGAIATLFGVNLTSREGIFVGGSPLPTSLEGTSVTVQGIAAPIFSIVNVQGQQQISFQIPYQVAGRTTADVVINNNGARNLAVTIPIRPTQPGIFLIGTQAAITHADGNLVTPSNPARAGEVLVLYATGLGVVTPAVPTGEAATELTATAPATVSIAGTNASVLYSGLAPGFPGLYQVNFAVPANARAGALDLTLTLAEATSNRVALEVR